MPGHSGEKCACTVACTCFHDESVVYDGHYRLHKYVAVFAGRSNNYFAVRETRSYEIAPAIIGTELSARYESRPHHRSCPSPTTVPVYSHHCHRSIPTTDLSPTARINYDRNGVASRHAFVIF